MSETIETNHGLFFLYQQFMHVKDFSTSNVSSPQGTIQYSMILSSFSWFCICIAEIFVVLVVTFCYLHEKKFYKKSLISIGYLLLSACSGALSFCGSIFHYSSESNARYSFFVTSIFMLYLSLLYKCIITMNWKVSLCIIPYLIAIPFIPNWLSLKILVPIIIFMILSHFWFLKKHFIGCMKLLLFCEFIYIGLFSFIDITNGIHCIILFIVLSVTEIIGFISVSEINYEIYESGRYIIKKRKVNKEV